MTDKPICSRLVEFREGSVTLYEDGTTRFFFRGMDYVYKPGQDTTDGMDITVGKETADGIASLFKREYWP